VTDHSEYVGVIRLANTPDSDVSKLPAAQPLITKADTPAEVQRVYLYAITTLLGGPPVNPLMSPEIASTVWTETVQIADQYYKPGKFTTFASYEWTAMPNNMNLHRNVFFQGHRPHPGDAIQRAGFTASRGLVTTSARMAMNVSASPSMRT
jgi:hypothetical protein